MQSLVLVKRFQLLDFEFNLCNQDNTTDTCILGKNLGGNLMLFVNIVLITTCTCIYNGKIKWKKFTGSKRCLLLVNKILAYIHSLTCMWVK